MFIYVCSGIFSPLLNFYLSDLVPPLNLIFNNKDIHYLLKFWDTASPSALYLTISTMLKVQFTNYCSDV